MSSSVIVFALSALLVCTLWASWAMGAKKRRKNVPPVDTKIRLRKGATVYVCRYLGLDGDAWKVSAPILRAEIAPLRPGEKLMADFRSPKGGVASFATQIVRRGSEGEAHMLLRAPYELTIHERRSAPRQSFEPLFAARVNGYLAELRDVASRGALLKTQSPLAPGDMASVVLPGLDATLKGLVLACYGVESSIWPGYFVRVSFPDGAWPKDSAFGEIKAPVG